ncbi:leucine-rich repeat-containing protein 69 isoform X1 [Poecilia reticulata]|uniref:leucine-rich repeat-containing protein 69 isoform X1 n=1 Tax=Poecilia reticulata TaxID=8081 RepID=UPI0004A30C59|nr:PREDICTED: leucine-rich repeat-containing protein 69 isoform X1 [Poecilia reticulata]
MAHGVALRGTVIKASCGKGYFLNLNSNRLKSVPEYVSRFPNLSVLLLSHNSISDLPTQLQSLRHLTELNLGNNVLREFPVVLKHLDSLRKLDLYRNKIDVVSPDAIGNLGNLVVLNLDHNNIQRLPPEIGRLRKLQHFSMLDNKLEELPGEVGCLKALSELNLNYNNLSSLPEQLYFCRSLLKLYAARNRLTNLPEGITALVKLQVLDVAGNRLSMFPIEFHLMHLTELYCDGNWLIKHKPVPLLPKPQMLSLKELAARLVLLEVRKEISLIKPSLPHYPELNDLLSSSKCCTECHGPFLSTWVECVHFVSLKKEMNLRSRLTIPVRALLCSYNCFRAEGPCYYGVEMK